MIILQENTNQDGILRDGVMILTGTYLLITGNLAVTDTETAVGTLTTATVQTAGIKCVGQVVITTEATTEDTMATVKTAWIDTIGKAVSYMTVTETTTKIAKTLPEIARIAVITAETHTEIHETDLPPRIAETPAAAQGEKSSVLSADALATLGNRVLIGKKS